MRHIYDPRVRPQTVCVSTNMEKHEREIREKNPRGEIMEQVIWEAFGKHLGSISEASGKHRGDIWETFGEN